MDAISQIGNEKKRRVNRFDLGELSKQLAEVDHHLVAVLGRRNYLARQVEEWKSLEESDPAKQVIIRPSIETKRLNEFAQLAESQGISPEFAKVILWTIIAESCRIQIDQKQARDLKEEKLFESDRPAWLRLLKDNLLKLTAMVAPSLYDTAMYGDKAPFATKSYMEYEHAIIQREINTLKAMGQTALAVDIGCATGRCSRHLASHFDQVVGYDISPEMINQALLQTTTAGVQNIAFVETDVERELIIAPNSVSFAVMNLGTASDIPDLRMLLARIHSMLCKDGRFVLSFYNRAALFYHWFIPWPIPLIAEINTVKHCLDVHVEKDIFQVYARPYTGREIGTYIHSAGLVPLEITTYPTMASILPDELFGEKEAKTTIQNIDRGLASGDHGAYIIVTGKKP